MRWPCSTPEVDGFDRARALLAKAGLDPNRDERDEARRAALHAFRRMGATPWAARLSSSLATTGMGALTEAERRILAEVAKGLTNQQIAKRLQLSAKTVANHLYNVYRKLGVASRTEAARHVLLEGDQRDGQQGR